MVNKSKNKLVSIIIRGKNESRWLRIVLKELKKQTYKKYEIIFCNNNSDDNTHIY
jgi:Glycosyltransferases involved in cell wall biogenesis